jgi:hypothetical protein
VLGNHFVANGKERSASNAMECFLTMVDKPFEIDSKAKPVRFRAPPICFVSVFNYSTNIMECLKLPVTNLCAVRLVDSLGNEVTNTPLGKEYGGFPSQQQIDSWRHHWTNRHESMFIRLTPNGLQKYSGFPTDVFSFSILDAFEIKNPGKYELHVQVRLVKSWKYGSATTLYPVIVLPEAISKVRITEKDLKGVAH